MTQPKEDCMNNLPKFILPFPEEINTSLLLILYRWKDNHYNEDSMNLNEVGAVVAIAEVFNSMLKEREKYVKD